MSTRIIYKDKFAVIGKMGQGSEKDVTKWIPPLWDDTNSNLQEIDPLVSRNENGSIAGVWGIMNDMTEQNKRWDSSGKYLAGCETGLDADVPDGWTKWIVPAQTYLVADCTLDTYSEVFGSILNDKKTVITATVHERYPQPGNPNVLELYFPIAEGMLFCQSCAMPMTKTEELGSESDGSRSLDYCCHCYKDGAFTSEDTMEQMIEICIPFCKGEYESDEAARDDMMSFFPKLKRWAK